MDKRKQSVSSKEICRFCLTRDEPLSSIYDKTRTAKCDPSLPMQILSTLSVEAFPSDGRLTYTCEKCRFFFDALFRFKQMCRQADESVLHYVQKGDPIERIAWPLKLTKIYKNATQASKRFSDRPKTMISETGARVQVTTSNVESDSDGNSGNVLNIQIDDGTDNSPNKKSCIKVIKAGDQIHITNEDVKIKSEPNLEPSRKGHKLKGPPFNCKLCGKYFVKELSLIKHAKNKHKDHSRHVRGPFGECEVYQCDECESTFMSQEELIYHSAKHATENLTCPLCQEKFNDVEEVSTHIKTHVEGAEFMCDLCELVFTSREKLDAHLIQKHEEDLRQEQDSQEEDTLDDNEEFEDSSIRVKKMNGEMVLEIKKPSEFLKQNTSADKSQEVSEESGHEDNSPMETEEEIADPLAKTEIVDITKIVKSIPQTSSPVKVDPKAKESLKVNEANNATHQRNNVTVKENSVPVNTNDKSLRLLEKELQELKRTNNRNETAKPKVIDQTRNKRNPIVTSTPKPSKVEEKKVQSTRNNLADKKAQDRKSLNATKKEEKDVSSTEKEGDKDRDSKEKENQKDTPKAEKNTEENVRRSSRTTKKDYVKMIRSKKSASSDDSTDEDEEYTAESRRSKRATPKAQEKSSVNQKANENNQKTNESTPPVRKRGRPKKYNNDVPAKVMKIEKEECNEDNSKEEVEDKQENEDKPPQANEKNDTKTNNILMSPTGQTLKQVPIKSLPPGVKPLPLPVNARPIGPGQVCEMQIGKKMVKVQKIVMTKAEVEAMAKKGLLEMKDGTMVLKQGIKLPTSDPNVIKSTLTSDETKE